MGKLRYWQLVGARRHEGRASSVIVKPVGSDFGSGCDFPKEQRRPSLEYDLSGIDLFQRPHRVV